MAYSRPQGKMVFSGRSQAAIEEDRRRLEQLREFVPMPLIGQRVASYLAEGCAQALQTAMVPAAIDDDDGNLPAIQQELLSAGEEFTQQENAQAIQTESAHARNEIVRSWVNLLSRAKSLTAERETALNQTLLLPEPSAFSEASRGEWSEAIEDEELSLQENLALKPQAILEVREAFASNLRGWTFKQRQLQLPHRLALIVGGQQRIYLLAER